MTLKDISNELHAYLHADQIDKAKHGRLDDFLNILAVKAEMVGGKHSEEIISLLDKCRTFVKRLINKENPTKSECLEYAQNMTKVSLYFDEDEFGEDITTKDDELEQEMEDCADDVRRAYKEYLDLRKYYFERFGEFPNMDNLL